MIHFALTDFMDEQACYDFLFNSLHPTGLHCPKGHLLPPTQAPHDRPRAPIMDYRCRGCGKVFNVFSGTSWSKTHYSCRIIVQILKGISQGTPTKHLAEELNIDRSRLTQRRHYLQSIVAANFPLPPG